MVETKVNAEATDRDLSMAEEFRSLVDQWRQDTRLISPIARKVMHPAYLKIIGMGRPALPLLLAELSARPSHLFVALYSIAHEDPAQGKTSFDEAVAAWLEWGREKGYL